MLPPPSYELTRDQIDDVARRIRPYGLLCTELLHSPALSHLAGREVWLKCENRQLTGSFKVRGALARLLQLRGEARARGVVAASAGNHGVGVAWACRQLGIPGLVVVPETVPRVKLDRLRTMLVKVRLHGNCYDEAEQYAKRLAEEAEATFISPFDDPWVMAGNGGTVGLEIAEQGPPWGCVLTPVGGGGLGTGLAVALGNTPVVGVNSEASPAMARSLAEQKVYLTWDAEPTLAEGLEGGVTPSSAALCARHLAAMLVVQEASIAEAIRLISRKHSMVIEGSAAVGVAAVLEGQPLPGSGPVCVVLTGRNIDAERLRQLLAA